MKKNSAADLWAKVEVRGPGECWLYSGAKSCDGYGIFCSTIASGHRAHRASWTLANGPIPDGMCVCHKCDVRDCVNPAHLFLGTNADNTRDMHAKGRHRAVKGEAVWSAKLNEEKVSVIRFLGARTNLAEAAIGALFGVSRNTIQNIMAKRVWRGVEMISF